VIDTDNQPRPDIKFYSEGGSPRAYVMESSTVSFVIAKVDTNMATVDTLYNLRMEPYGTRAKRVDPLGWALKDWQRNFYLPQCGANGVTAVEGYSRVIYPAIFTKIDMHFYSGSRSQKMAFVMKPGCNVSDLKLRFSGQDSIDTDLWGNLKLYYNGKFFIIPYVQAYQVDGLGGIVPVSWAATYDPNEDGTGVVGFTWSNYNPLLPLIFQMGIPPFGAQEYDEEGLCGSTYMGGNENDQVYESVEDENDNYYIVGTTGSTFMSFPQAPGINYSSAGRVAYMMRFNTTDNIVWKTFFGGQVEGELIRGTAIGHKVGGQVYMGGFTNSASMFHAQTGSEFSQTAANPGVYKGFNARLNKPDAVREWSTYYGGDNTFINGMVGLANKKIYIVGSTNSTIPALDLAPPTNSTYWPYSNEVDGFLSMFNDTDQHGWRTHIPGTTSDAAYDVDATGARVVMMGVTHSADLNLQPFGGNSYSVGPFGSDDCYLYEFDENGVVQWSTYVGTIGPERSFENGLAIDPITKDIVLVGAGPLALDVVEGPGWHQGQYPPTSSPGFIARFSGVDRSRTWHTYLHNGAGSVVYPTTCAFDPTGKLLLASYLLGGTGVLLQPLSGLYQQSAFNADVSGNSVEQKDPIVTVFGTNNQLLYGSYLGGEANAAMPEYIFTVLHRRANGNIYLAGTTSKEADPMSYFPLDDGGGVPYFEDDWQGGTSEGFLAAICGETLNQVGMVERGTLPTLLSANWSYDQMLVFGLPLGLHSYRVVDALGRLVVHDAARSDGRILRGHLPSLAQGSYMFHAGIYTARFTVTR